MDRIPNLTGKRKRRNFGYKSTVSVYDKMRTTTVGQILTYSVATLLSTFCKISNVGTFLMDFSYRPLNPLHICSDAWIFGSSPD